MNFALIEKAAEKVSSKWAAEVLAPAIAFWIGGAALLVWKRGLEAPEKWLRQRPSTEQVFLAVIALIVFLLSAKLIERFGPTIARLLEGDWPTWAVYPRHIAIERQRRKWDKLRRRLQQLARKTHDSLSEDEWRQLHKIQLTLHSYPSRRAAIMPTRLGNVLRAAELRPLDKYGLDTAICWPRLWLLIPDAVRSDVGESRAEMDVAIRSFVWSTFFCVWAFVTPWAFAISAAGVFLTYHDLRHTTETYGTLLESTFDVHRPLLYRSLGWPLPKNAAHEPAHGAELSNYLWAGSHNAEVAFEYDNFQEHTKQPTAPGELSSGSALPVPILRPDCRETGT